MQFDGLAEGRQCFARTPSGKQCLAPLAIRLRTDSYDPIGGNLGDSSVCQLDSIRMSTFPHA